MSESDRAHPKDVSRWDLPSVEGAPLPRAGAKGVNVMHLTLVEREAWEHGFKDGTSKACARAKPSSPNASPKWT
jgi:hypothetical protein